MSEDDAIRPRVTAFLEGFGTATPPSVGAFEQLELLLEEKIRAARAAWPDVSVDEAAFLRYVAERLEPNTPLPGALEEVHADDLYAACAAAAGDARAVAAIEARYFEEIELACKKYGSRAPAAADVVQAIRLKLFVDGESSARKIREFSGRGSLRGWIRVIAARTLLNEARRGSREVAADSEWIGRLASPLSGPEDELVKESYGKELRAALVEAMGQLPSQDKNILRFGLSQGLSIDQIAAIYNVHRSTAARRLRAARDALAAHVRSILMQRLALGEEEFESLLRAALSRVDLTLTRCFE